MTARVGGLEDRIHRDQVRALGNVLVHIYCEELLITTNLRPGVAAIRWLPNAFIIEEHENGLKVLRKTASQSQMLYYSLNALTRNSDVVQLAPGTWTEIRISFRPAVQAQRARCGDQCRHQEEQLGKEFSCKLARHFM
jgi:hypothetical protein